MAKVAFSYEASLTVKHTSLRQTVRRKVVERYRIIDWIPILKSGFQSISVWATFSTNGRTPSILMEVT